MRKGGWHIAALALAAVLTGCGAGAETARDVQGVQNKQVVESVTTAADWKREQAKAGLTDEEKNWMGGLTAEQRLHDFESLCDGLRENYPYLTLAKRQVGADIDVLEKSYRDQVKDCESDDAYYKVLQEFVRKFAFTGHLDLWGRRYESELALLREVAKEPGQAERLAPYINALDNPISRSTYASMTDFYEKAALLEEEKLAEENDVARGEAASTAADGEAAETTEETVEEATPVNVKTRILEPGKTAYVFIDAFDYETMDADREILLPFYEEVRDYENLIIDITNNLGGSMRYFDELVTAPLARETYTVPTYQFFKDGENNRTFLRVEEGSASGLYQPVRELPDLPKLNQDDVADCAWFLREDYTVEPAGDGFAGKIWLLVSGNNYSSSEYAAMFAKASGFATLVGETTRGDGIGTDPAYLILPESGLVVQYSPMYGVTADGTGSEECGTEPDIVSPEGETALETCLRYIEREKSGL